MSEPLTVPEGLAYNGGLHGGFRVRTGLPGVTYHSRNSSPAPWVSRTVVSGTSRSTCGRIAPEIRTKPAGAIGYCLKQAGITIQDVEWICSPLKTYVNYRERLTECFKFTSFRDRQMMHCGIGILFLSGTQSLMLRFDSGEAFARAAL